MNDLEFLNSPINEVVLGVQFDPPLGYTQIRAGEVWSLFKGDFPNVQEQPALPPSFEVFGLHQNRQFNIEIGNSAGHDRFWFLNIDGTELIQFQCDRLLHNWRKRDLPSQKPYPRFTSILQKFTSEANSLEKYMSGIVEQKLSIRQCEISYFNYLKINNQQNPIRSWLKFFQPTMEPEDFSIVFRHRISQSSESGPQGRLNVEAMTARDEKGAPFIRLSFTVRGVSAEPTIQSAIEFFHLGREIIGDAFCEMTTESAHKAWGRIK
jgi:uncharacterized protein (TIGR04255 family)